MHVLGSIIKVQAVRKCLQEYIINYILHLEFWEHFLLKHKTLIAIFLCSTSTADTEETEHVILTEWQINN